MRTATLLAVLVGGLFTFGAAGQTPPPAKPAEPKKESVEDDIARMLRTHPDVLVAEAEERLAAAKLQQAKRNIALKVAAAKRTRERAVAEQELAEKGHKAALAVMAKMQEQVTAMKRLGMAVSQIELIQLEVTYERCHAATTEAERAVAAAKGKRADAEAEYDALVGPAVPPKMARQETLSVIYDVHAERLRIDGPGQLTILQPQPGSAADKLRTLLAKPVAFEAKDVHIEDAVRVLKAAAGMDFRVRVPEGYRAKFTFPKDELTLAAWLELIQDQWNAEMTGTSFQKPTQWYVREYGLNFSAEGRPEGAVTLSEFLKATRAAKPDAGGPPKK